MPKRAALRAHACRADAETSSSDPRSLRAAAPPISRPLAPQRPRSPMLSLWSMIKVCLLGCNAIAILNRPRFLDKVEARCSNEMATQAVNFAKAAQYLRPILIPLNIVCIFVEMLFGA